MSEYVLNFEDYTFRYRAQSEPTLYNINLKIKRGEKILILGPSGSGKSTLVHCINGIIPHAFKGESSGELYLSGRNSKELDIFEISKMAGTVLQDTDGQFVGLSAAEDIAFALENDCVPLDEMRARVMETSLLVGMSEHLNKSPQDLSGGQKQRISMAGVLVDNVDILLFDEPLANLDPAAGKDAIELIDDIHKKTGKTIIIIEHRLEDTLHKPVDRIIMMDKGRIICDMKPNELLATGLLKDTGIREPLYLSAAKYSKINIDSSNNAQHLDTLNCDLSPLVQWNEYLTQSATQFPAQSATQFPAQSATQFPAQSATQFPAQRNIDAEKSSKLLEVKNLRFRYSEDGKEALKNVSFSAAAGECMGLIGKNGSGKSTMAKCICGFVKPDYGSIYYDGQDISGLSIMQRAEKIGFVMQNPNQMISFPMIYDEAAFGLRTRGASEKEIKEKVEASLQTCGLYPFRNWPVSALSYGQKKRLTIASILVLKPSLIILDEPTAGQDFRAYTEFMEFLIHLKQDLNICLVLITHDMHLMLEYTERAVVLSDGECIADKKPSEILTDDLIIEKASLKRTSLYDLAIRAGLNDAQGFVDRFLKYDREKRKAS